VINPDLTFVQITPVSGKMDDTIELLIGLPDAQILKDVKMIRVQRRTDVGSNRTHKFFWVVQYHDRPSLSPWERVRVRVLAAAMEFPGSSLGIHYPEASASLRR